MPKILLENITFLRKYYGLTKKEMAEKLEIGIWTLNQIEKGVLPPRLKIDILFHVYKEFGVFMSDSISIPLESRKGKELLDEMKSLPLGEGGKNL